MFFTRETFFLGGGNDIPINNQSRCTVVVIRRNSKDDHIPLDH
ncbi:MAG: hypothetical protein ABGX69_00730 [Methylococcales bacterium]